MTYSTGKLDHQPASQTIKSQHKGHTMRTLAQSTAIHSTFSIYNLGSLLRIAFELLMLIGLFTLTGCSNFEVQNDIPSSIQIQIDEDEDYYELTDDDLETIERVNLSIKYESLNLSDEDLEAIYQHANDDEWIKRWIQEIQDITVNGLDTFHETTKSGSCESDVHTEVENGDNTYILQDNQIVGYCYIGWDA